jgi:hypothetical protein
MTIDGASLSHDRGVDAKHGAATTALLFLALALRPVAAGLAEFLATLLEIAIEADGKTRLHDRYVVSASINR